MASKNNAGFSLLETVIALTIMLIAGTMVSRYLVTGRKAAQEVESINQGRQDLLNMLQKIRREFGMRDSRVPPVVDKSLSFAIPLSSVSSASYSMKIRSLCRPLPNGETIDTSQVKQGLSCLQSLNCGNGVPYAEWTYTGHPQLTKREWPDAKVYEVQQKKAFGAPGLGFCFSQTADSLVMEGIVVYLKKEGTRRIATVQSESLSIPLVKRNRIELVP